MLCSAIKNGVKLSRIKNMVPNEVGLELKPNKFQNNFKNYRKW